MRCDAHFDDLSDCNARRIDFRQEELDFDRIERHQMEHRLAGVHELSRVHQPPRNEAVERGANTGIGDRPFGQADPRCEGL